MNADEFQRLLAPQHVIGDKLQHLAPPVSRLYMVDDCWATGFHEIPIGEMIGVIFRSKKTEVFRAHMIDMWASHGAVTIERIIIGQVTELEGPIAQRHARSLSYLFSLAQKGVMVVAEVRNRSPVKIAFNISLIGKGLTHD